MKTLLTYDVDDKQKEVKDELLRKGYYKSWSNENITYYLPNTTVWRDNTTPSTAIADIKSITANLRVKLTRAVAVDFPTWDGIEGDPN